MPRSSLSVKQKNVANEAAPTGAMKPFSSALMTGLLQRFQAAILLMPENRHELGATERMLQNCVSASGKHKKSLQPRVWVCRNKQHKYPKNFLFHPTLHLQSDSRKMSLHLDVLELALLEQSQAVT